jgi:hypothetical protein
MRGTSKYLFSSCRHIIKYVESTKYSNKTYSFFYILFRLPVSNLSITRILNASQQGGNMRDWSSNTTSCIHVSSKPVAARAREREQQENTSTTHA